MYGGSSSMFENGLAPVYDFKTSKTIYINRQNECVKGCSPMEAKGEQKGH